MIIASSHDGAKFDKSIIEANDFLINHDRDLTTVSIYDSNTGDVIDRIETVYNFVGFVSNRDNNLMVVFPKHTKITNLEIDSKLTFKCIAKHMQSRPDLYIGSVSQKNYTSNYPFAAFFAIYNYFTNYGLYIEEVKIIKPSEGGKVSWKDTISKCHKYLVGGNIFLFPLYSKKNHHFSTFITECMIYAIDYTIHKFGFLIDLPATGATLSEANIFKDIDFVITTLQQLRQQTFKDNSLMLIDNLIEFFLNVNTGGIFYLKHYNFSSIWENMVENYLCKYYKEINANHEIVFDKMAPAQLSFNKKSFFVNAANSAQFISPDHYAADNSNQLIFDAKYYSHITGINYKQIAYVFMLRELRETLSQPPQFKRTHAALILPSETRKTEMHFSLNPLFRDTLPNVVITEEYLDVIDVMNTYIDTL